jgi:hypothetical protein
MADSPLYQRIGNLGRFRRRWSSAIQECVKSVTAKFGRRLVTSELVKQQIQKPNPSSTIHLEKGVENAISIANLAITDFNFSPEFNKVSQVQAEQQALQAKNEAEAGPQAGGGGERWAPKRNLFDRVQSKWADAFDVTER